MSREGFLTDEEVGDALGRGAGMFYIPNILHPDNRFYRNRFYRKGFYVDPEDGEEGVVVVLADDSAILVHPEDFTVKDGVARWIGGGEGSQGHTLEVIGRAYNVRRARA